MYNIIYLAVSQYFLYYLFNYTLIFNSLHKKVKYNFDLFKVTKSWKYHLLYPFFCALCFTFHLTWMMIIFHLIFNFGITVSPWNLAVSPMVAVGLDGIFRILGKYAN